jgi:sterol desaturase/sphingolipid hydroxylase (fatty acid hydroxylase superfamily)
MVLADCGFVRCQFATLKITAFYLDCSNVCRPSCTVGSVILFALGKVLGSKVQRKFNDNQHDLSAGYMIGIIGWSHITVKLEGWTSWMEHSNINTTTSSWMDLSNINTTTKCLACIWMVATTLLFGWIVRFVYIVEHHDAFHRNSTFGRSNRLHHRTS